METYSDLWNGMKTWFRMEFFVPAPHGSDAFCNQIHGIITNIDNLVLLGTLELYSLIIRGKGKWIRGAKRFPA